MKTIIIPVLRQSVGIALMLIFAVSCNRNPEIAENPGFTTYIAGFTSGQISKQSGILVRLAEEYPEIAEPNQPLDKKLFQISPSIKGNAFWIDNRTIEFIPDDNMKSGTNYKVSFSLSKLIEVPDHLKSFNFEFQTFKQNIDLSLGGQQVYDLKNLRWLSIEGTLHSADIIE